eukprot:TRINITY_DN7243_c0_g1_i5.p1 TRINITY_DN7243_c0_g1~~TRINITY_DN7243_c0_g1_i5.p1  ORF type:complete len:272 (-),score=71.90 TRINITY_DN7243_c0_g1_i5:14-829(-)
MGDLNYRIIYGDQGDELSPSEKQFNEMVDIISSNQFQTFYASDQLLNEMKARKVFLGFQETIPKFPPTFKVLREPHLKYLNQRSPAWCDRILWRSVEGSSVSQSSYHPALACPTSDHKPVCGEFEVTTSYSPPHDPGAGECILTIENLKGKNLPIADLNNSSDPFLKFISPYLVKSLKTSVQKMTLNPTWTDSLTGHLNANSQKFLSTQFLSIIVFDFDKGRQDDLLGYGILSLGAAVANKGQKTDFQISLTRGGLDAGSLSGSLKLTWKK